MEPVPPAFGTGYKKHTATLARRGESQTFLPGPSDTSGLPKKEPFI